MRTLILSCMLAVACGPTATESDADTDITPLPDLPVARCGMAPYTLLPTPQGAVVSHEPRSDLTLPAGLLDVLLREAELTPFVPSKHGFVTSSFRYMTQDKGEAVEATALLMLPDDATGPLPLTLSLHFFAGILGGCPPSEELERGLVAGLLAAHGHIVVVPDYIGLSVGDEETGVVHGPLVSEQIAAASWDAVVAARTLLAGELASALPDGASVRDDVSILGASQGGHAALSVAHLQPWFAPDEQIAGVVSAVAPHDLTAAIRMTRGLEFGEGPGLSLQALLGMRRWYAPDEPLTGLVSADLAATLDPILADPTLSCTSDVDLDDDAELVDEVFSAGFLDASEADALGAYDPWGCWLEANTVSRSGIPRLVDVPVLMTYGDADDVVRTDVQLADVATLCDQGWDLEVLVCEDADHAGGGVFSMPEQFAFLDTALAGEAAQGSCSVPAPVRCSATIDQE